MTMEMTTRSCLKSGNVLLLVPSTTATAAAVIDSDRDRGPESRWNCGWNSRGYSCGLRCYNGRDAGDIGDAPYTIETLTLYIARLCIIGKIVERPFLVSLSVWHRFRESESQIRNYFRNPPEGERIQTFRVYTTFTMKISTEGIFQLCNTTIRQLFNESGPSFVKTFK